MAVIGPANIEDSPIRFSAVRSARRSEQATSVVMVRRAISWSSHAAIFRGLASASVRTGPRADSAA
ncbi:hypothetical protein B7495_09325 [Cryobacterium sp. LW097]|nr:hypothetical protein B7495_09325 [Cryobacterium sp. LW097]